MIGLAIGVVNGSAVDRLGIPAFIVTLAGLQGYRGLTMLVSGGMTVAGMPDWLGLFANTSMFGVSDDVRRHGRHRSGRRNTCSGHALGRYMYAVGSNMEAARRVGVNVTA